MARLLANKCLLKVFFPFIQNQHSFSKTFSSHLPQFHPDHPSPYLSKFKPVINLPIRLQIKFHNKKFQRMICMCANERKQVFLLLFVVLFRRWFRVAGNGMPLKHLHVFAISKRDVRRGRILKNGMGKSRGQFFFAMAILLCFERVREFWKWETFWKLLG